MRITKSQKVECCAECFLYKPDRDMSATIPACRELDDRELDSHLKFKGKNNITNSIALNCPFLSKTKDVMYQLRPLTGSESKDYDFVIEKVPKSDLEGLPTALSYFYFRDIVNNFSSLGLYVNVLGKIREGIMRRHKVYIKRNGDMCIKGKVHPGAFKPFFEGASKRPYLINIPKNEDAVVIPKSFNVCIKNEIRNEISETLERAASEIADCPDRSRKIARLQKDLLKAMGIDVETDI